MKKLLTISALGLSLALTMPAVAGEVTVGVDNSGNCYPFLCNDTGVTSGESIDYQQVYASSQFGANPYAISSLSFSLFPFTFGSSSTLTGTYDVYLGYTSDAVNNLSTNLSSNFVAGSELLFATYTGGGSGQFTITGTPFDYNPANGNLLMEIIATNQASVPNGTTNGYNWADNTGLVTSRAYCLSGGPDAGCFANTDQFGNSYGLVTQFNLSAVPEPGTLALFGIGLLAFGGLRAAVFVSTGDGLWAQVASHHPFGACVSGASSSTASVSDAMTPALRRCGDHHA
jgi:hypothetical protein